MNGMREFLREHLRRSVEAMPEEDRLATAWPVVCGAAMAVHGEVVGYHEGIVRVAVSDANWMQQMISMRGQIGGELGRIAGVRVTEVHFERKKTA